MNFHPDRLVARFLRRAAMPIWLRRSAQWIVVALAWSSVIGSALSIIASAQWVIDIAVISYRFAAAHAPLLLLVFDFLHAGVVLWRAITKPVFEFVFGWLPFDVPRLTLDVVILGVILGGFVRGWLATSIERQFMRAISPRLTDFGRLAVLKNVYAAIEVLDRAREMEDRVEGEELADRAEGQLVDALDVLTESAGTSRRDDEVIDEIMTRKGDGIRDMMNYIENVKDIERLIRRGVLLRSAAVASISMAVLGIDAIYVWLR